MDHRILNNTTKTLALLFLTTWSTDGLFASAKTPKTPPSAKTKATKTPRSTAKKTTPRKAVELSDSSEEENFIRNPATDNPGVAQASFDSDSDQRSPFSSQHFDQERDFSRVAYFENAQGQVSMKKQGDMETYNVLLQGNFHHNNRENHTVIGAPIAFQEEALAPGQEEVTPGSGRKATARTTASSPRRPKWNGPFQICHVGNSRDKTPRERRILEDLNLTVYTLANVDKGTPIQGELSLENQFLAISTYYIDPEKQQTLPELTLEDCKQTKAALDLHLEKSDYKNGTWIGKYLKKVSDKIERSIWFIEVGTKFPCQDAIVKCVYSNFETGEVSEKTLSCWSLRNLWSDRKMLNPDLKKPRGEVIIYNSKYQRTFFSCQFLLGSIVDDLNTSSDPNLQNNISFEQKTRWAKNTVTSTFTSSVFLGVCQSGYQHYKDPISRGLQSTGNFFSKGWNKFKSSFQKQPDPVQ